MTGNNEKIILDIPESQKSIENRGHAVFYFRRIKNLPGINSGGLKICALGYLERSPAESHLPIGIKDQAGRETHQYEKS